MPAAIIAGLGLEYYGAFRGWRFTVAGWQVRTVPSRRRNNDFDSCFRELESILEECVDSDDGTHVLAFHSKRSDRDALRARFGIHSRLAWCSDEEARLYGTNAFVSAMQGRLLIEEHWNKGVRPPNIKSPLMLPPQFLVPQPFSEIWRRAEKAKEVAEIDNIDAIIERFVESYYVTDPSDKQKSRAFRAANDLIFRFPNAGAYHGHHVPWKRRRKFTSKIPKGFHYDVAHARDRAFTVGSAEGDRTIETYANIDPYGALRVPGL